MVATGGMSTTSDEAFNAFINLHSLDIYIHSTAIRTANELIHLDDGLVTRGGTEH